MKIKSFTKSIYKSTFLTSLASNIVTSIILIFLCKWLIFNIYEENYKNTSIRINEYINEVLNNDQIYDKIKKFEEGNDSEILKDIELILKQKRYLYNSLNIYFQESTKLPSQILPDNLDHIYNLNRNSKNIINKIVNYQNELYVLNIIEFKKHTFMEFFNLSKSSEFLNMYSTNDFIGFSYNDNFFDLNRKHVHVNQKKILLPSTINLNNIFLIFSSQDLYKDSFVLFYAILLMAIIRFFSSILNAKRNIRKITKPLDELVYNTEKLAAHEVCEKLNRFDYPYYEFKQLAEAFNKVLLSRELSEIKLFRSFEQMENVVHKRTQELITTNEQLTHAIKKAEDANALKSQFLANISHEIRTPLNCIMGFCDIILTEDHSEAVTVQVKQILHESETLLHLINDFLDYSKIDAGKMTIVETELDIRSLISSLLKSGQIQATNKDLYLDYNIDDSVPLLILSDELRLYQILSNIFYNAIKFTPSGNIKIDITTSDFNNDDHLTLQISIVDTGIGIPPNRIDSIFNKFEQVDGSLTRKYRGSGLGLTICKKIIELMNGTIKVESEINVGTKFYISIPVKLPKNTHVKLKAPIIDESEKHTKGSNILLVEDYPVNQIVAKKHLEMDNHIVIIAENGQEAIAQCELLQFDLILMDLQMPIMDGFKATKIIRGSIGLNSHTPILAMTANAMDTAKQTCLDTGMNGIITKPIRKKIFLQEVDKWLKISNQ